MQIDAREAELLGQLPTDGTGKTLLLYGPGSPPLLRELAARGYSIQRMAREPGQAENLHDNLIVRDVARDGLIDSYDVVVCTYSSNHFRNPLKCLESLAVSARLLFLAVLGDPAVEGRNKPTRKMVWRGLLRRLPILLLIPAGKKHKMDQAFALSSPLVISFFKFLRQDFASVQVLEGGGARQRLLVARRRSIGHLIILAGVNAVGKSTFLNGLRSGSLPEIAREIGMESPDAWEFTRYVSLLENEDQAHHENVLVQYNMTDPFIHGEMHDYHQGLLDLVKCARRSTIVTMWLPHAEQKKRYLDDRVPDGLFSRELYLKRKSAKQSDSGGGKTVRRSFLSAFYFRSGYTRRKADRLLEIYASQESHSHMYRRWMDFAERHGGRSLVLMQGKEYRIVTGEEWQKLAAIHD